MRVCLGCGNIAPTQRADCGNCGTTFEGKTAEVPQRDDGFMWARYKAYFKCRSCGAKVPMNYFDVDGAVLCAACGVDQQFSWGKWRESLEHAHNVADLAGENRPPPDSWLWYALAKKEWDDTPKLYQAIGVDKSTLTKSGGVIGEVNPVVEASPGHPVCKKCSEPLGVEVQDAGKARSWCPVCGNQATYELPQKVMEYTELKAALSTEHRTDSPPVKTTQAPGGTAYAIACPHCGAPLEDPDAGGMVSCGYCQTTSRIPAKVHEKSTGKADKPRDWWMLFAPPSKLRAELELKKDHYEQKARAKEEKKVEKEKKKARAAKTNLVKLVGGGVGAVVLVAIVIIVGPSKMCDIAQRITGFKATAEGKFEAMKGSRVGEWVWEPNTCSSGQHQGFHGVWLKKDGDKDHGIRVTRGSSGAPEVTVRIPGTDRGLVLKKCKVLRAEIHRTNKTYNDIRLLKGSVEIDCPSQKIKGSATFNNCH